MHPFETPVGVPTQRRKLLLQGLGLGLLAAASLAGCGGGGGDDDPGPDPDPGPGSTQPTGRLVYRNTGVVGVYDFATQRELQFDPGETLSLDPGVTVSAAGVISVSRGSDNDGFDFALFGLDGQQLSVHRVPSELAFQTSAVMFNPAGTRAAFSMNALTSASNDDRIDRTLVLDWPGGNVLASLDGYEEPVWAGNTGELVVRDAETLALRLFGNDLVDRGPLAGLVVGPLIGGYNLSADGRYVVYDDGSVLQAYDRNSSTRWVAAQDRTSAMHAPCISPGGRHVAVIARDQLIFVPHVMPFEVGLTVDVESTLHALDTIADLRARMGWTA